MKRKYIEMDYHLARACATDEANRNMRKNGRKAWNEEDYNICVEAFNRLWPTSVKLLQNHSLACQGSYGVAHTAAFRPDSLSRAHISALEPIP